MAVAAVAAVAGFAGFVALGVYWPASVAPNAIVIPVSWSGVSV